MEYQLFKITQNAIIQNSEKLVLILKDPTGNWLLPGGKINKGEAWEDGLRREIKEETGIENFEINKILSIDSRIEDDKDKGAYVVVFLIDVPDVSQIKLSDEHVEYAWVGLDDLDKYQFWHEDIRGRIKMVFE